MTKIWELDSIKDDETPSSNSVTIISDGILTKKISIDNMKRVLVPMASSTILGSIKIGQGLSIDSFGTVSIPDVGGYILPYASAASLGGVKVGSNLIIDHNGILDTKYPLSPASKTTYGLVKIGDGLDNTVDGILSVTIPDHTLFPTSGFRMGNNSDITLLLEENTKPKLKSNIFGTLAFSVNDSTLNINEHPNDITNDIRRHTAEISLINSTTSVSLGGELFPALIPDVYNNNITIGISTIPWSAIYATSMYGTLYGVSIKTNTILVDNIYRAASVASVSNTVVVRDAASDVFVNIVHGNLNGIADKSDTLKVNSDYRATAVDSPAVGTADTIVVRDSNGDIHANNFSGISNKSDYLRFDTTYYSTAEQATPNTVAVRDLSGNLTATYFNGIAVKAQFADLAEKYISDKIYDSGTVVVFGGTEEISITTKKGDHRVAGVISANPAYIMNEDSNGQLVALRGKVPVKIIGKVEKGDLLITSSIPGYAMSIGGDNSYGNAVFAKSLENKPDLNHGTVIAVIL